MFILGLDLGQARDYTALAIIEKPEGAIYNVRRLERTRGTPYPDVVSRVKEILKKLPGAALVVDATGVGAPVVDAFQQAGLKPIAIYIMAEIESPATAKLIEFRKETLLASCRYFCRTRV